MKFKTNPSPENINETKLDIPSKKLKKIFLENIHVQNKLQYQSKNSLELDKSINTLINYPSQGNLNATSEKRIANLIAENFAQAFSNKFSPINST